MHEESKEKYFLVQEKSVEIDLPTKDRVSLSVFFDKIHSINGLHLLSALFQIILGSLFVALSVLEVIYPVWIASIMTVIGSIAMVTGTYFLYYIFNNSRIFGSLLHTAIKRVINNQN